MKTILTKIRRNNIPNRQIAFTLGLSKEALDAYKARLLPDPILAWIDTKLTEQFGLYNIQRRKSRRKDANYGITFNKFIGRGA